MEERAKEVLEEWLENPYWRDYYEKAPSEECRKYISLDFLYSDTEDEEVAEEMDRVLETLGVEDLKHLLMYDGNTPFGQKLREMIAEKEG